MLLRAFLSLAFLVATPAWSQVVPEATGGTDIPDDDSRMPIPPLVSGQAFPTNTLSEAQANYLEAGLAFGPAYYDNLLPNYGSHPISDMAYSIMPNFQLDLSTPRLNQMWTYTPVVTVYQRSNGLSEIDQDASLSLQYRLSEHATVSAQDMFQKGSNIFNQPYSLLGGPISGSPPSSPAEVVAPFTDMLTNTANAEVTYQFSLNGMIGANGTTSLLSFPKQIQATGLYDSNSRGGSGFYSRRLFSSQYIGVSFQDVNIVGKPVNAQFEVQTQTVFPFYAAYLKHSLDLSLAVGPQHYNYTQSPLPATGSWTPSVTGSMAWQRYRTNFAVSYSRSVTGAGFLLGAFHSNTASAFARWKLSRTWAIQSTANYALYKNVFPSSLSSGLGGHSVLGSVSIDHSLREHIKAVLGYERLHESYNGIAALSNDPESDRVFISISYQFRRPLGR